MPQNLVAGAISLKVGKFDANNKTIEGLELTIVGQQDLTDITAKQMLDLRKDIGQQLLDVLLPAYVKLFNS